MAAFIFDFDGTIADSFDYVLDFLAREIQGPESRAREHHGDFRGLSMRHMATRLGARPWKLPFLFFRGRKEMGPALATISAFADIPELIAKLKADGHELYLVSVNLKQNIMPFLENHKLEDYFDDVIGSASIFGKAPILRRLILEKKLDPGTTWYIGDEASDTRAAHKAGLQAAAVTWGYNNLERLTAAKPEALVFTPNELLELPHA